MHAVYLNCIQVGDTVILAHRTVWHVLVCGLEIEWDNFTCTRVKHVAASMGRWSYFDLQ